MAVKIFKTFALIVTTVIFLGVLSQNYLDQRDVKVISKRKSPFPTIDVNPGEGTEKLDQANGTFSRSFAKGISDDNVQSDANVGTYVPDWQTVKRKTFYVYSAHLDVRRGRNQVRVFGAIHKDHLKDPISCVFLVAGVNRTAVRADVHNVNPHDVMFPDVDVMCPFLLDPWALPDDSWVFLSIETDSAVPPTSAKLKIEQAFKRRGTRTFTVCLWAPLHTSTSAWLIEWVEANLMFGADLIYVYELNFESADTRRILHYYRDLGVVKILPWHKPSDVRGKRIDHDNFQLTMIGDCQHRNMNQTKYVAGFDLDELIVPRGPSRTWSDMIKHSGCPGNPSFSASHMLFEYNKLSRIDDTCAKQLACRDATLSSDGCGDVSRQFLRSACTTERLQVVLTYPTRTKYFASPEVPERFHIHKPGVFANICRTNYTVGALHHFRKSKVGGFKRNTTIVVIDTTMHLYREKLSQRFQITFRNLRNSITND